MIHILLIKEMKWILTLPKNKKLPAMVTQDSSAPVKLDQWEGLGRNKHGFIMFVSRVRGPKIGNLVQILVISVKRNAILFFPVYLENDLMVEITPMRNKLALQQKDPRYDVTEKQWRHIQKYLRENPVPMTEKPMHNTAQKPKPKHRAVLGK